MLDFFFTNFYLYVCTLLRVIGYEDIMDPNMNDASSDINTAQIAADNITACAPDAPAEAKAPAESNAYAEAIAPAEAKAPVEASALADKDGSDATADVLKADAAGTPESESAGILSSSKDAAQNPENGATADEESPAKTDENGLTLSDENKADKRLDEVAADATLPAHRKTDFKSLLTKDNVTKELKYFALLILMAFMRAFFNFVFILPNGFAPGGIGGISTIIYNAILPSNPHLANTVFEPGLTTFVMNVPLLIASCLILSKRFTFNTFMVIAVYSGFTSLFSSIDNFPQYDANGDTGLQIIAALIGGAVTGICLGVMLRNNMSMGGTDIIGKILYKRHPQAGANWWILACDCTVALSSCVLGILKLKGQSVEPTEALTAILSPILFSYLSLIVCSITADVIQSGFQSSLVFNIITDKPDEIAKKISTRLHRGVTVSKAVGYYTGIEHEVLLCVTSKKQINVVKNIIAETDPNAFTYITKAREVAGKGFRAGS